MKSPTPGPWQTDGCGDIFQRTASGLDEQRVAQTIDDDGDPFNSGDGAMDIALANARLIAAAPELLNELKAFEQLITGLSSDLGFHLSVVPISIERVRSVRAAIAKAEGR